MAAADWEEVKRLAADFQRAQLSSTSQRLSERNCHEIVSRLIELKLLEALYTCDGKSYVTPQELSKEIKEELVVHGGRVNLVDVQQALNVDLAHVESKASEIVRSDKSLALILGQIIGSNYLDQIFDEVNDELQDTGHVTVGELTKKYSLPGDFLRKELHSRLGTIVLGRVDLLDSDTIYTDRYINRLRAQIRGVFSAITKPTPISSILGRCSVQERLFTSILEDLVASKRLLGVLSSNKSTYLPDIYTSAQNDWVDSFFKQNGYLEYDALSRLGLADPKAYIQKKYGSEQLVLLSSCCVGHALKEQLEAHIDEAAVTDGWIDCAANLPSALSRADTSQLVQKLAKTRSDLVVLSGSVVTTQKFVGSLLTLFDERMIQKANKDSKLNAAIFAESKKSLPTVAGDQGNTRDARKEERRKKAAGGAKAGGGTQGREGKTKAVKNKFKGRGGAAHEASDDEDVDEAGDDTVSARSARPGEVDFMKPDEIEAVIKKVASFQSCPADAVGEIATLLYKPLRSKYQDVAKSVFMQTTNPTSSKRMQQASVEEKINSIYSSIRMFERATALAAGELQSVLTKHLLRTLCSDMVNTITEAAAAENMTSVEVAEWTAEVRTRVISTLPEPVKGLLTKLHLALAGKSLSDFFGRLDEALAPEHMAIVLRKMDKKKERQLTFNHRHLLLEDLQKDRDDAALSLHLAVVILFQLSTQAPVHCTGKAVPMLVDFLHEQSHVTSEQHSVLVRCQELIVKQAKGGGDAMAELQPELAQLLQSVKDIVAEKRKHGGGPAAAGAQADD